MSANVLGRTNRQFPSVWLRLLATSTSSPAFDEFIRAAQMAKTPLDISSAPGLWGGLLRGDATTELMTVSNTDYEHATSSAHAADLIQAHLLETLSAIGREKIDFYFLTSRSRLQETQLSGALQTIEMARQEGHIGFVGIHAEGPEDATYANWHLHDAFELISLTGPSATLRSIAQQRRVGIIDRTTAPSSLGPGVSLVPVRNSSEIAAALEAAA